MADTRGRRGCAFGRSEQVWNDYKWVYNSQ